MAAALMSKVSGAVAAILWLGSAGLWAYSSSIEIREDLDAIVGDLQRAAYWNSRAARVACAAAIASCVYAFCDVLR